MSKAKRSQTMLKRHWDNITRLTGKVLRKIPSKVKRQKIEASLSDLEVRFAEWLFVDQVVEVLPNKSVMDRLRQLNMMKENLPKGELSATPRERIEDEIEKLEKRMDKVSTEPLRKAAKRLSLSWKKGKSSFLGSLRESHDFGLINKIRTSFDSLTHPLVGAPEDEDLAVVVPWDLRTEKQKEEGDDETPRPRNWPGLKAIPDIAGEVRLIDLIYSALREIHESRYDKSVVETISTRYGLPHEDVLWLSSVLAKKRLSKKDLRDERRRSRAEDREDRISREEWTENDEAKFKSEEQKDEDEEKAEQKEKDTDDKEKGDEENQKGDEPEHPQDLHPGNHRKRAKDAWEAILDKLPRAINHYAKAFDVEYEQGSYDPVKKTFLGKEHRRTHLPESSDEPGIVLTPSKVIYLPPSAAAWSSRTLTRKLVKCSVDIFFKLSNVLVKNKLDGYINRLFLKEEDIDHLITGLNSLVEESESEVQKVKREKVLEDIEKQLKQYPHSERAQKFHEMWAEQSEHFTSMFTDKRFIPLFHRWVLEVVTSMVMRSSTPKHVPFPVVDFIRKMSSLGRASQFLRDEVSEVRMELMKSPGTEGAMDSLKRALSRV